MKTTRVYITGTPDMHRHVERAKKIANEKGCDPVEVRWPKVMPPESDVSARAEYDNEVKVCQKQFRELISECDLFFAIAGNGYGNLEVPAGNLPGLHTVSPVHYEILQARASGSNLREKIFVRQNDASAKAMLLAEGVPKNDRFETDRQFEEVFSRELAEHRQLTLTTYLESLERFNLTITCRRDKAGLLAALADVVRSLHGNLAGGSQITKGNVILRFVAEWAKEKCPGQQEITKAVTEAFSLMFPRGQEAEGTRDQFVVEVTKHSSPGQEFRILLTFVITFVDQPGIADHVFTVTRDHNASVLLTEVDTFLSGGMMLGRIRFRVRGDQFGPDAQKGIEEKLRKLPGILHVDSTALRGRFWE